MLCCHRCFHFNNCFSLVTNKSYYQHLVSNQVAQLSFCFLFVMINSLCVSLRGTNKSDKNNTVDFLKSSEILCGHAPIMEDSLLRLRNQSSSLGFKMSLPCQVYGSAHSAGDPPPEPWHSPICTLWPKHRRAACAEPVPLQAAQ